MFIKECLGAEGCKLSDIKPIICKTYPFAVDQGATEIVKILRCPAHKEIISNEENIKRVLLVRKEAGYKDNYVYIGKVLNFLHAHGINPQRNFLKDAEFMSKLVER
ncbi:MAG: hypothetical protein WCG98_05920 [bacterium]